MLHKNWCDYTEKELDRIKETECVNCKYFKNSYNKNGLGYCDYLNIAGERRGVRPENCNHHKEE